MGCAHIAPTPTRAAVAPPPAKHACDRFDYLLFPSCTRAPTAFRTLDQLARDLSRQARGAGLDGANVSIGLNGSLNTRLVAAMWVMENGARGRFLGYAWLGGEPDSYLRLADAILAVHRVTVLS